MSSYSFHHLFQTQFQDLYQNLVFGNSHRRWPGLSSFFVWLGVKRTAQCWSNKREIQTGSWFYQTLPNVFPKLCQSSIEVFFPNLSFYARKHIHRHSKKKLSLISNSISRFYFGKTLLNVFNFQDIGFCRLGGKDVIYSQDLGYSILGLRILNPGNLVLGLRFKDPES